MGHPAKPTQLPDGPPPLRFYDHPHGLPHNNRRGWTQTKVGSQLMRFIIDMVLACAAMGASAFLEHPAFPVWIASKRPSSIWTSRVMRLLKRLQCVQVVTFDQCLFQCEARKPTTLLLLRLPFLRKQILNMGRSGRCDHPVGYHQALRGRGYDGSFRTAIAKIYPAALNRALACAIVQPLPPDLDALRTFDFGHSDEVQPDFYAK